MTTQQHTCQILQHAFNLTDTSHIIVVGEGITGKSIARFLGDLGYCFILVDIHGRSATVCGHDGVEFFGLSGPAGQ